MFRISKSSKIEEICYYTKPKYWEKRRGRDDQSLLVFWTGSESAFEPASPFGHRISAWILAILRDTRLCDLGAIDLGGRGYKNILFAELSVLTSNKLNFSSMGLCSLLSYCEPAAFEMYSITISSLSCMKYFS